MEGRHLELLDNPVWNALQTRHSQYGLGVTGVLKYPADMLPFIGFKKRRDMPFWQVFLTE